MTIFSEKLRQVFASDHFSDSPETESCLRSWASYLGRAPEKLESWLAETTFPSPSNLRMLRGLTRPDAIFDSKNTEWAKNFEVVLGTPIEKVVLPANIQFINEQAALVKEPPPKTLLEYAQLPAFPRK